MSDQVNTVVIRDSGFIDDVDKYCEITSSTKFGTPLRRMELAFVKEDSITYKCTQSYTGINKHSGKRWFKVVTILHLTYKIRELSNGKKYLYVWSIPTNRKVRNHPIDIPVSEFPRDETLNDLVVKFCGNHIGKIPEYLGDLTLWNAVGYYSRPNHYLFPGMSGEPNSIIRKAGLSPRTSDPNDIMKFYLGGRYSKKLAGLLRGRSSNVFLRSLSLLPKMFKTEWLVESIKNLLSERPNTFFTSYLSFNLSDYMEDIVSLGFRRNLLGLLIEHPDTVNDIFRLYRRIGVTKETFKDYKNNLTSDYQQLREEHDRLSELARSIEDQNYTKPYELEPIPENLSGLGFRLPTSNKDLSDWSKHFNNCVSGYAREVSNEETLVLNWNDEVCLEIRDKKLVQYLGKYNRNVTPEMFWDGVDILLKYDMIDETPDSSCWGYQEQQAKELANG